MSLQSWCSTAFPTNSTLAFVIHLLSSFPSQRHLSIQDPPNFTLWSENKGLSSFLTKTDSCVCYWSIYGAVIKSSCSALLLQSGGSSSTGHQNVEAWPCKGLDHKSDSLGFLTAFCCCVICDWLFYIPGWNSGPSYTGGKLLWLLTPGVLLFLHKVSQTWFGLGCKNTVNTCSLNLKEKVNLKPPFTNQSPWGRHVYWQLLKWLQYTHFRLICNQMSLLINSNSSSLKAASVPRTI